MSGWAKQVKVEYKHDGIALCAGGLTFDSDAAS